MRFQGSESDDESSKREALAEALSTFCSVVRKGQLPKGDEKDLLNASGKLSMQDILPIYNVSPMQLECLASQGSHSIVRCIVGCLIIVHIGSCAGVCSSSNLLCSALLPNDLCSAGGTTADCTVPCHQECAQELAKCLASGGEEKGCAANFRICEIISARVSRMSRCASAWSPAHSHETSVELCFQSSRAFRTCQGGWTLTLHWCVLRRGTCST
jgi:hypothetical protein